MASSGKKKTTMAKLQREGRLRERRLDKQARKDARKRAAADPSENPVEHLTGLEHLSGDENPNGDPEASGVDERLLPADEASTDRVDSPVAQAEAHSGD